MTGQMHTTASVSRFFQMEDILLDETEFDAIILGTSAMQSMLAGALQVICVQFQFHMLSIVCRKTRALP